MIIDTVNDGILLRWRDENREIQSKKVDFQEFPPRFYIRAKEVEMKEVRGRDNFGSFTLTPKYRKTDFVNLDGEKLKEVTWSPPNPAFAKTMRNWFGRNDIDTYEGDVPHHHRYAVENPDFFPEYEMRKWYWDMEWMQGGEHDEAITCIVRYDSYDKEYQTYVWYPDPPISTDAEGKEVSSYENWESYVNCLWAGNKIRVFANEKKMLQAFLGDMIHRDPDMLISWFGWKFDLPKLIERLIHNKLDAQLLSPCDEVTGVYWDVKKKIVTMDKKRVNSYSPTYQPIKGRLCVALDAAFERQWMDSQRGTLPSMALDFVGETVLGRKKLVSGKFPDKNEFFARAWQEDEETYLLYAKIDVELLVELDRTNHITEAVLSLQRLLKAPFDACFHATKMAAIYFMRNASWKAPTGKKEVMRSYDGAMVYDPLSEGTNGLHLGVAAFDFAGLYPSMMIARNISWETKSIVPTEFSVNIKTPKDFSPETEFKMRYFKTDELGLLPRSLLGLKKLRNEYKANMKKAKDEDEYVMWNNNQLAVKRLMASFYGIVGFQGYGWCDIELAEAITASAREAIRKAASEARKLE